MSTRAWIHGYTGRMGLELRALMEQNPAHWQLCGGTAAGRLFESSPADEKQDWTLLTKHLQSIDILIDFSALAGNLELYAHLQKTPLQNKAVLIGTTGLSANDQGAWMQLAREKNWRLLMAPNTSIGVLLTLKLSELAAKILSPLGFDAEILESHHRAKRDAPSGTAKFLAAGIAAATRKEEIYGREGLRQPQEIGIAALRGGQVFGEHEVRFLGDNEEITISHRALNRSLFASGALLLARWLLQQKPGVYRLEEIALEDLLQLLEIK